MEAVLKKAKRILTATYLVGVHALLLYFIGGLLLEKYVFIQPSDTRSVADPTERVSIPTPAPVPDVFADQVDENANISLPAVPRSSSGFVIPVLGVKPEQLIDTFSSGRSENRYHDAIDIPAPAGTPVVAAADGEIVKFWDSERGGITIYQLTADKKFLLYYAHLQRRADEISVGSKVRQGATIGFVGDTGNAGAGNYHLHFSIATVTDPKRFHEGTHINPYPVLRNGTYPSIP